MNPFLQVEAQRGPEACAVLTTLKRWGFRNPFSDYPSLFLRSGGSFLKPTLGISSQEQVCSRCIKWAQEWFSEGERGPLVTSGPHMCASVRPFQSQALPVVGEVGVRR